MYTGPIVILPACSLPLIIIRHLECFLDKALDPYWYLIEDQLLELFGIQLDILALLRVVFLDRAHIVDTLQHTIKLGGRLRQVIGRNLSLMGSLLQLPEPILVAAIVELE